MASEDIIVQTTNYTIYLIILEDVFVHITQFPKIFYANLVVIDIHVSE